jgi:histidine triad (HIT) family protein
VGRFLPAGTRDAGPHSLFPGSTSSTCGKREPPLASELMRAVVRVGHAIYKALSPEGMNLITSAGNAAEQTIFHLHLHVVPRWRRDEFGPIWPIGSRFKDSSIDRVAERIREACQVG